MRTRPWDSDSRKWAVAGVSKYRIIGRTCASWRRCIDGGGSIVTEGGEIGGGGSGGSVWEEEVGREGGRGGGRGGLSWEEEGQAGDLWPVLLQWKQITAFRQVMVAWPLSPHLKQTRNPFLERERNWANFWETELRGGGFLVAGWERIEDRTISEKLGRGKQPGATSDLEIEGIGFSGVLEEAWEREADGTDKMAPSWEMDGAKILQDAVQLLLQRRCEG